MFNIVSKVKIDGVERHARLFKSPKYAGGPTLWVVTNAEEFGIRDSFTYSWDDETNGLVWNADFSNRQLLHDIAAGIFPACEAIGIPVE